MVIFFLENPPHFTDHMDKYSILSESPKIFCMCLPSCICTHYMQREKLEDDIESGTGATGSLESPVRFWESNPGPLFMNSKFSC